MGPLLWLSVSDTFLWDYNDAQRMGLTSGTKLGPYEIVLPLGAGGKGAVYRARNTRPNRTVAVKILPSYPWTIDVTYNTALASNVLPERAYANKRSSLRLSAGFRSGSGQS